MQRFLIPSFFWLFLFAGLRFCAAQTLPLPKAHAHNDYLHRKPLFQALENGFTSIEVDVHLRKNKLKVGHVGPKIGRNKTLRKMYLDPLKKWIEEHEGAVYPGFTDPVIIMVDIKTDARATYDVLLRLLQDYRTMLYHHSNGEILPGPVRIVLSGGRVPAKERLDDPEWLIYYDGYPGDLDANIPSDFMPRISTHYKSVLSWRGKGEIPEAERKRLTELCDKAHAQGKKVRLWACPQDEKVWETLLECGVDWINADNLARCRTFFEKRMANTE